MRVKYLNTRITGKSVIIHRISILCLKMRKNKIKLQNRNWKPGLFIEKISLKSNKRFFNVPRQIGSKEMQRTIFTRYQSCYLKDILQKRKKITPIHCAQSPIFLAKVLIGVYLQCPSLKRGVVKEVAKWILFNLERFFV